jgi:hypothetical protein
MPFNFTSQLFTASGRAYHRLLRARTFAVGLVGPAARVPREEHALRVLLQDPNAISLLLALLDRATPAGQLYALLGLRMTQHDLSHQADALRQRTDEVVVRNCCFSSHQPVSLMASKIEDGTIILTS